MNFAQIAAFSQHLNDLSPMDNPTAAICEMFTHEPLNRNQLHIFVKCLSVGEFALHSFLHGCSGSSFNSSRSYRWVVLCIRRVRSISNSIVSTETVQPGSEDGHFDVARKSSVDSESE